MKAFHNKIFAIIVAVFLTASVVSMAGEEALAVKVDADVVNMRPIVVKPVWFRFGIVSQNNGKPSGILVKDITPGSEASKVGLKNDMEVISINGVSVEEAINRKQLSTTEIWAALAALDYNNEKIVLVVKDTGFFGRTKTVEVPPRGVQKTLPPAQLVGRQ